MQDSLKRQILMNTLRSTTLSVLKKISPVIIVGFVSFIVYRLFQKYDLQKIIREIQNISLEALLWAGGLTALNYLILTLYDMLAVRYIGKRLNPFKVGFTAFISYTVSHNVGAALVSGGAVRYRLYSRWGFTVGEITKIVLFAGFHYWAGLFFLGGFVCLIFPKSFGLALGFSHILSLIIGVSLLIPIFYYLYLTLKPGRALNIKSWSMEIPSLKVAFSALIVACADWMCAAAVLYNLLPHHKTVPFTECLVAYLAAQMGGVMSHVPGGLGVFESIIVLALEKEYAGEALVGSLILFRFFYYFAPFALGALSYIAYELKIHKIPVGILFSRKS